MRFILEAAKTGELGIKSTGVDPDAFANKGSTEILEISYVLVKMGS